MQVALQHQKSYWFVIIHVISFVTERHKIRNQGNGELADRELSGREKKRMGKLADRKTEMISQQIKQKTTY